MEKEAVVLGVLGLVALIALLNLSNKRQKPSKEEDIMSKKPILDDVSTGYASNTTLNSNFTKLNDALDNTLSLDGSSPNAMGADLDMNKLHDMRKNAEDYAHKMGFRTDSYKVSLILSHTGC